MNVVLINQLFNFSLSSNYIYWAIKQLMKYVNFWALPKPTPPMNEPVDCTESNTVYIYVTTISFGKYTNSTKYTCIQFFKTLGSSFWSSWRTHHSSCLSCNPRCDIKARAIYCETPCSSCGWSKFFMTVEYVEGMCQIGWLTEGIESWIWHCFFLLNLGFNFQCLKMLAGKTK